MRVNIGGVHTKIVSLSVRARAVPERASGDGARNIASVFLEHVEEGHDVAQFGFLGLEGSRRVL